MDRLPAVLLSAFVGLFVVAVLGYALIPLFRRLEYGQTVPFSDISRQKKKTYITSMSGIFLIAGIIVSVAVVLITDYLMDGDIVAGDSILPGNLKVKLFSGILTALEYAIIGFVDDYLKIIKKQNLGLTFFQKTTAQILVTGGYLFSMHMAGATYMFIPFYGNVDLGLFFWIIGPFFMYFTVNAVSITDSIDGLCVSVTSIFSVTGIVIALLRGVMGTGILCAALSGSLAGYVFITRFVSKGRLGSTGSMFLGGLVIAVSYGLDMLWLILLTGIVYVLEAASELIHISYFRLTDGKRIFKTAPLHNHFLKCGWSEKKTLFVFSLINTAGCVAAVLMIVYGQPK